MTMLCHLIITTCLPAEAGEEARHPEGMAQAFGADARPFDESPQLRAPPGRARGVLLPSLSPLSAHQAHLSGESAAEQDHHHAPACHPRGASMQRL